MQLQEKFRSIFNKGSEPTVPARVPSPSLSFLEAARKDAPSARQSRGLEQFFFNLHGQVGLSILDLAGASQQNIAFLTNLGHKIYSANVIHSMEEC